MKEIQHTPLNLDYFITLPDEKIILAERQHWINMSRSIVFIILLSLPFYIFFYILFNYYLHYPLLFVSTILIISCLTISLILKSVMDWYFHLFIVTNRKILEVYFSPLFFYKVNGILLDQVRCTEIDEKKHGIFNEIIDMGDVIITFDRPTHQEEFVILGIKNPRRIAVLLSNTFANMNDTASQQIWYKVHRSTNVFPLTRQTFGRYSLGGR